jgi:hypothetical protein
VIGEKGKGRLLHRGQPFDTSPTMSSIFDSSPTLACG